MKRMLSFVVLILSLSASADQCASMSVDELTDAAALLTKGRRIISWCQSCGTDPLPILEMSDDAQILIGKADVDGAISLSAAYAGTPTFKAMDQKEIDAAYIYVKTGSQTFTNLAHLIGCAPSYRDASGKKVSMPVQGVTPFVESNDANGSILTPYYYDKNGVRRDAKKVTVIIGKNKTFERHDDGRKPASKSKK